MRTSSNGISKKTTLHPVAFCSSRPPDVPRAYNVNSSSGCLRPGLFCPGATILRPDASGAVRRTLPSNHTPGAKPLPPAVPDAPRLACCLPRRLAIASSPLPLGPGSIPSYSTPSELRPHSHSQSTCHPEHSYTPPFLPHPADVLPLLLFSAPYPPLPSMSTRPPLCILPSPADVLPFFFFSSLPILAQHVFIHLTYLTCL